MLKFKVKEVMLSTGKINPGTWLTKHCEMDMGKAYKILNGKQKSISLKDFSKLCENLNCTPNDLMYWEQTAHTQVPAHHPCITQLVAPDKISDWNQIFKKLSPSKVKELHRLALEDIENKNPKSTG